MPSKSYFLCLFKVLQYILLLVGGMCAGQAQQDVQDSLELLLNSSTTTIDKIDYNLGLARYHLITTGQAEISKPYAINALTLAQEIKSKKYQAIALGFVAQIDYVLAIPYDSSFKKAFHIANQSGDADAKLFTSYLLVERVFSSADQDSAITLLNDVLSTVDNNTTKKHIGNTLKVLAYAHERLGQFDEAEMNYLKAIEVLKDNVENPSINPDIGRVSSMEYDGGAGNVGQCYTYVALVYVLKGEYDKARQHIQDGIATANKGGPASLAGALGYSGLVYREMGDFSEAIASYQQAINLLEVTKEPLWIGDMYIKLGQIYTDMGEYKDAEKNFQKASELIEEIPNVAADLYLDMGELYSNWSKSEEAIQAYLKADEIYQDLGEPLKHFTCQLSIAELQIESENVEIPLLDIKGLLPKIEALNDYELIHKAYLTISKMERFNGRLDEAILMAQKALGVAEARNNDLVMRKECHQILSILYEEKGEYKVGLFHHKQYKETADSLITELAVQKLKEQQVSQNIKSYIADKENAENLSKVLTTQKNLYLIVSLLLGLLLAGGAFLIFQLRKTRIKIESQNLELNELNATKDRFFGIIAHDIRSPIAALQSVHTQMSYFAAKGKTDKLIDLSAMVGSTAQRLNSLLDNLLNWAMLQTKAIPYHPVTLQVSKVVRESVELFRTSAMNKDVTIDIDIDDSIEIFADLQALHTIIRNLLSNAIKYSHEGEVITIDAKSNNDQTKINVKDTGIGMSKEQLKAAYRVGKKSESGTQGENGTGLGLVLIHELVILNHGEMQIESAKGVGTTVTISMTSYK